MHPHTFKFCILVTTYKMQGKPLSTMQKSVPIVALLVAACALSSCVQLPPAPSPPPPVSEESRLSLAEIQLKSGNYQQAASIFWDIAITKHSPQREALQIRAAETALRPETKSQARKYLDAIDESALAQGLLVKKRIADAKLELMSGQPQLVLDALPHDIVDLSAEHKPNVLVLRSQALYAVGKIGKFWETLTVLNHLLTDSAQKEKNNQLIWESLMDSELMEISAWAESSSNCDLAAWLSLAHIFKQAHKNLFTLENKMQMWHTQFPNHMIPAQIVDSVVQEWASAQVAPERIALLLPMTGRFSVNAEAIYAGIATAREFEETLGPPPDLVLYDTGDNAADAVSYYQRAVQEGANFIIGPLQKEAVSRIAKQEQLAVPTLSLNYTNDANAGSPQLFQLGLLPENEARQVAERASHDSLQTALALVPEGEWGTRLLETFKTRFSELGGVVLQSERYIAKNPDYSGPIKSLLQLDQSERRRRDLQKTIHRKVKFEPRRRQDADFVFIAAFPQQARLLRPQLSYHYASDLPVYATSHIFSGNENISADQDIEGITYCDIPWLLSNSPKVELLRDSFELQLSNSESRLPRFAALGVDAYRIIPHLQRLAAHKNDYYEGMTGKLSVGGQNRIFRKLAWAQFRKGRPQALHPFAKDFPRNVPIATAPAESQPARTRACQ